ncbi:MAG TPA: hypothetical protein VE152_01850 [Acidimicrobiales bacterium]|nr:hypothetical protein [Acidimicrobiales bacterium]
MPWCESCSQFQDKSTVSRKGECPVCGRVIAKPVRVPWHFKILIIATAAYLAYRLYQGIVLLVHVL